MVVCGQLCPLLSWFPFWCTSTTGCSITAYDELLTKVPAPVRFAAFTFFMPRWEAATAALKVRYMCIDVDVPS